MSVHRLIVRNVENAKVGMTVAPLPDHPPAIFNWRGKRRKVKCADGPERIFGEWWTRDAEYAAVRDYLLLEP